MSEENEHSYYEISLTGAQMVIGFVVLLGCLLVAFFAGVWLGRGGRAAEQAVVARQQETQQDENAAQGKDPASLDQFNFFSNEDQPQKAPSSQPEAKAETGGGSTTLREDVNGASQPAEAKPEAAVKSNALSPPAQASGFVIQVFSTNDRPQAEKVLERLRGGGLPAFLSPVEVEGRTMHRVRVGPFADRDKAEAAAAKIRKSYRLDTWITQGG